MKSFIKALSFAAIFGLFATSCETDPCKDVLCGDHGTCLEGTCNCETGYEKDAAGLCNIEQRAKFLGTWNVADDCSNSGTTPYQVIISNLSTGIFDVKIANFWEFFVMDVTAVVSGDTITISRQQPDNDNYFVIGTGTINDAGNSITWSYTISDETGTTPLLDVCTATWTK
jgi:hypothetical protein